MKAAHRIFADAFELEFACDEVGERTRQQHRLSDLLGEGFQARGHVDRGADHREVPYRLHTESAALSSLLDKCYIVLMTTAEDLEKAVEQLAPGELARFRAWFDEFDARQFDAAIERDVEAGRLDGLADEALVAHRAGRSREL